MTAARRKTRGIRTLLLSASMMHFSESMTPWWHVNGATLSHFGIM
jgi:hypothetical protein